MVQGYTSTGSKRPETLFGPAPPPDLPCRMTKAEGVLVWDDGGRVYTDYIMALGAVALGYAHPAVTEAAEQAIRAGVVGPLSPVEEEELAWRLSARLPWLESLRFLKTGAEAVQAAVRIARTATRRDHILSAGYHGWLDWCQREPGVPGAVQALREELPFNDIDMAVSGIRERGDRLAAVVVEPVIDAPPRVEWLEVLRQETERVGAVLIFDEIKTAFRIAVGGAVERYGVRPDLVVLGKALANGFPLAVVGGRREYMAAADRTWISSTLATEAVALAAARATLEVMTEEDVPRVLRRRGEQLFTGLERVAARFPDTIAGVRGMPEMCYLEHRDAEVRHRLVRAMASRGILWKGTAYNFVSLAHSEEVIERALTTLEECAATC